SPEAKSLPPPPFIPDVHQTPTPIISSYTTPPATPPTAPRHSSSPEYQTHIIARHTPSPS
ncbi:hypothetical protein PTTG_09844, partial [Puccinia triticina 1-1 BBBD Race 1]